MTRRFNKILAAIMAILIVTATGCTAQNNTVNSTVNSNTTTSATESSVPETEVEDVTSEVPETEDNTSIPETPASDEVSVPESEAPEPETTPPPVTEVPETTTTTTIIKPETPAPKWTETKCNKTMYVNTSCYSRKEAIMGAQAVKLYNVNDKVTVIATTDTGYGKLNDGTFIHQDYLSNSKVAESEPTTPPETTHPTTTTTTKPQETPEPDNDTVKIEQINKMVYTNKKNVKRYFEADCIEVICCLGNDGKYYINGKPVDTPMGCGSISSFYGMAFTAIEYIKEKGVYKCEDGFYVKEEDIVLEDPIEEIFHTPFDIEAIRQYIIDDAVNNYGLVLNEKMDTLEGATWFSPTRYAQGYAPWVIRDKTVGMVSGTLKLDPGMRAGDNFNIIIIQSPYGDEEYDLYFLRG